MNKRNRRRIRLATHEAHRAWLNIGALQEQLRDLTKSVANLGARVEQNALDEDRLAHEIRWAKGDASLAVEEAMSRVRADFKRVAKLEKDLDVLSAIVARLDRDMTELRVARRVLGVEMKDALRHEIDAVTEALVEHDARFEGLEDFTRVVKLEADLATLRNFANAQAEANRNAWAQTQALIMQAVKANETPVNKG